MHTILSFVLGLCSIAGTSQSPANCRKCTVASKLPKSFQVVSTTQLTTTGAIVYVALPRKILDSMTPDKLESLACALQVRYPPGSNVLVLVFDNKKSAARYVGSFEQEKPPDWKANERALRASYLSDPKPQEHHLSWYVGGSAVQSFDLCRAEEAGPH